VSFPKIGFRLSIAGQGKLFGIMPSTRRKLCRRFDQAIVRFSPAAAMPYWTDTESKPTADGE
jgi:hypothetical protein